MSQKYEDILRESVEKLSLGPKDIVIVKSPEAMDTFIDMTRNGHGFSEYANPILFVPGGLEKATKQDLIDAIKILEDYEKNTETTSKIITVLN
jgi:hypothetical protein